MVFVKFQQGLWFLRFFCVEWCTALKTELHSCITINPPCFHSFWSYCLGLSYTCFPLLRPIMYDIVLTWFNGFDSHKWQCSRACPNKLNPAVAWDDNIMDISLQQITLMVKLVHICINLVTIQTEIILVLTE